eukprot:scaffold2349_cov140-Skeletonema_menzelii.AAC.5
MEVITRRCLFPQIQHTKMVLSIVTINPGFARIKTWIVPVWKHTKNGQRHKNTAALISGIS